MAALASKACTGVNTNGIEYLEFSCIYPSVEPFYFSWEKYYDPIPILDWMGDRPWLPIMIVALYGVLIVWGQRYMKDKEAWQWRNVLAVWNLSLSVFSTIGTIRTLPQLVHNLTTMPMRQVFCDTPQRNYGCGSTGLWVQLFILSKIPELFDTFFIVIHKKPLILLHWYHHVTVLLYCWHSYVSMSPFGHFFVTMNYAVHASMYGYYFLMAIKMKPKWLKPMFITVSQISQMAVGVAVAVTAYYYHNEDVVGDCHIHASNNYAAFIMYGSYLFLFSQFFIFRYFKNTSVKIKKK